MSGDGSAELQEALFDALTYALAPIKVHDHKPQTVPAEGYPYVMLGDTDSDDWGAKASLGSELSPQIEIYSRHRGRKESRAIAATIYDTLHEQSLTLANGFEIVLMRYVDANYLQAGDGLTYQTTVRYRVLMNYNP